MINRTHVSNVFKAAISGAALYWVFRDIDLRELLQTWLSASPSLLLVALVIFMATPVLQGVRLRRLLAAEGTSIGLGESIRLAFAGNFMNFAIPVGSTTGDVFKAAYLGKRSVNSWEAAAVTFIDRGVGLGTLLLSVTAIALICGPSSPLAPLRLTLVVLSIGMIAALAFVRYAPIDGTTLDRFGWLPARDALARIINTARGRATSPRILGLAILDTLGIQIAATASFLCAAIALGFVLGPGEWMEMYAYFSAGEIVKALPGPPQGLGTLEASYGVFFAKWATPSQIISAAVAIRGINLVCSIPGIPMAVSSIPAPRLGQPVRSSAVPLR